MKLRTLLWVTILSLLGVAVALTQEGQLPGFDPHTRIYVIRPGDTLWDLAGKAFQDPWKWPRIWFNNPKIKNPHLIYPGDPLVLPRVSGEITTPEAPAAALPAPSTVPPEEVPLAREATPPAPPPLAPPPPAPRAKAEPSPAPPQAVTELPRGYGEEVQESRLTVEERAVPELPPGLYVRLGNEGLIDPGVKPLENEILGGIEEDREIFAAGDLLYVSNAAGNLKAGDLLYAYRDQGKLEDPDSGRMLGRWIVIRGVLKVEKVQGEVAHVVVTKSFDSIEKQELLLPYVSRSKGISPRYNARKITGKIVALPERHAVAGHYQVVYAALGSSQGVREGDFVEIVRKEKPRTARRSGEEVAIPERSIGKGVVIEVGQEVSTVLIVATTTDIHRGEDFVSTLLPPSTPHGTSP